MPLLKNKTLLPNSLKLLSAMGAALALGGMAHAQGTDAGRTVSNTFTLDYSVNDVSQPSITNAGGTPGDPDGPTIFTVDRLIDLTVAQTNSPQTVAPGTLAADAQLTFNVTNTGNDVQTYSFSLFDVAANDDFNFVPGTEVITVNVGGTVSTVTPVARGTTSTTQITPDIPAGTTFTVTVSGEIPITAVNADIEDLALVAETRDPSAFAFETGTPTAGDLTIGVNFEGASTITNDLVNAAQNVFADNDSDDAPSFPSGNIDEALNGVAHDVGRFIVATPNVTGEKTVGIISTDGSDCTDFNVAPSNTQFAIPGACVEYVITVTNLGADDPSGNPIPGDDIPATAVVVADTLPAELIFVAATVEDFTGTAPTASPALPPANTVCNGTNCEVRYENGVVAAPGNTAGTPTVARVRIRALLQ